ncbi:hypothetical protein BB558_005593 [Smittium angustum]|uniref:AAA+ ATPase domain-containing protein n=1 Tax=Smittium angustum TaxID=133377 RepID=A0A2U1J021_SMIAN|nr:hypothetical protein BB558_005593 [Smittium angustum]
MLAREFSVTCRPGVLQIYRMSIPKKYKIPAHFFHTKLSKYSETKSLYTNSIVENSQTLSLTHLNFIQKKYFHNDSDPNKNEIDSNDTKQEAVSDTSKEFDIKEPKNDSLNITDTPQNDIEFTSENTETQKKTKHLPHGLAKSLIVGEPNSLKSISTSTTGNLDFYSTHVLNNQNIDRSTRTTTKNNDNTQYTEYFKEVERDVLINVVSGLTKCSHMLLYQQDEWGEDGALNTINKAAKVTNSKVIAIDIPDWSVIGAGLSHLFEDLTIVSHIYIPPPELSGDGTSVYGNKAKSQNKKTNSKESSSDKQFFISAQQSLSKDVLKNPLSDIETRILDDRLLELLKSRVIFDTNSNQPQSLIVVVKNLGDLLNTRIGYTLFNRLLKSAHSLNEQIIRDIGKYELAISNGEDIKPPVRGPCMIVGMMHPSIFNPGISPPLLPPFDSNPSAPNATTSSIYTASQTTSNDFFDPSLYFSDKKLPTFSQDSSQSPIIVSISSSGTSSTSKTAKMISSQLSDLNKSTGLLDLDKKLQYSDEMPIGSSLFSRLALPLSNLDFMRSGSEIPCFWNVLTTNSIDKLDDITLDTFYKQKTIISKRQKAVYLQLMNRNAALIRNICALNDIKDIKLPPGIESNFQGNIKNDLYTDGNLDFINTKDSNQLVSKEKLFKFLQLIPGDIPGRFFLSETFIHRLVKNAIGIAALERLHETNQNMEQLRELDESPKSQDSNNVYSVGDLGSKTRNRIKEKNISQSSSYKRGTMWGSLPKRSTLNYKHLIESWLEMVSSYKNMGDYVLTNPTSKAYSVSMCENTYDFEFSDETLNNQSDTTKEVYTPEVSELDKANETLGIHKQSLANNESLSGINNNNDSNINSEESEGQTDSSFVRYFNHKLIPEIAKPYIESPPGSVGDIVKDRNTVDIEDYLEENGISGENTENFYEGKSNQNESEDGGDDKSGDIIIETKSNLSEKEDKNIKKQVEAIIEDPVKENDDELDNETIKRLQNLNKRDLNSYERKLLSCIVDPTSIPSGFSSVCAKPETIITLQELISLPLLYPELYSSNGILSKHLTSGLLLFGPPGTGKTMLAKAVAKESGSTVLNIKSSDVYDKYVGEGEKLVKAIFSLARKVSPCVVFIDEVDALFGTRSNDQSMGYKRDIINQFMAEWDGLTSNNKNKGNKSKVMVMAATNRPFDLDDAILRRLPRRIMVDLPDEVERLKILQLHLEGESLKNVDLEKIAKKAVLYSGSDLKNLCIGAALSAIREKISKKLETIKKGINPAEKSTVKRVDPANTIEAKSLEEKKDDINSNPTPSIDANMLTEYIRLKRKEKIAKNNNAGSKIALKRKNVQEDDEKLDILERHFEMAFKMVSSSCSDDMNSIMELRKWDEKFGDGAKDRKPKLALGFIDLKK